MTLDTPDELQDDDEMKAKLEESVKDAHPEENPENDPFATDALGNKPAQNIPGGEAQEDSETDAQ